MRIDLIRRPIHYVHSAAIGFPAGDAGGEVLVGIGHTAIMLFFEFVLDRIRSGIAALPEGFDELVALFVVRKQLESFLLFVSDDPAHVLVKPLLVSLAHFLLEGFCVLLFLLFGERTLERIAFSCRGAFSIFGRSASTVRGA